jgi:outer membrane murein-binding lipoprotein Lpp
MRFTRLLTLLLTLCCVTQLVIVAGCSDAKRVTDLEDKNNELQDQVAELQANRETQPGDKQAGPHSVGGANAQAAPEVAAGFKGKIAKDYEDSVEYWAPKKRPPKDAPNVIIFLLDDTGFGQIGSFGGLVNTPISIGSLPADYVTTISIQRHFARHRGQH